MHHQRDKPEAENDAIKTPISGMVLLNDRLRARVPGTSTGSRSGIIIIRYYGSDAAREQLKCDAPSGRVFSRKLPRTTKALLRTESLCLRTLTN